MKKKSRFLFLIFFLLFVSKGSATSESYTFLMHSNRVFVETGTLYGDGIQKAILSGFNLIHSIELSPKYYLLSQERFKDKENVSIYLGDSGKILYDVIKNIDDPITFWLDSHFAGWDTAYAGKMTPILDELEQIKRHHINTHTILIDDVRQFGTYYFDNITLDQILSKLYDINPNYKISFEKGFVENDILVAHVQ